jgi:hypothetical protein
LEDPFVSNERNRRIKEEIVDLQRQTSQEVIKGK